MRGLVQRLGRGLAVAVCVLILPCSSRAQWVPRPGEGTISVSYQYTKIGDHLFSQDVNGLVDPASGYVGGPGKHWFLGNVYGQTTELELDYGIWRGLATSASASNVSSRYSGRFPEGPLDNGRYHGGLQDVSLGLRYMAPWQGFAITPSLDARFPANDYSTLGHTSIGKGLSEVAAGIAVGRSLDPLLPRAYVDASFAYAFVENHHGHSLDQHRYELGVGYIFGRSLSLGGNLRYVSTVDGLDWYTDDLTPDEAWHDHDAAAKAKDLRAGGYLSFSVWRDLSMRLAYTGTIDGENTHSGRSWTVAPTWSFLTPMARWRSAGTTGASPQR